MQNNKRVLVAMSGGIDSSVAAILLKEQGYEVIGITMKTWDYASHSTSTGQKQTGCCDLDAFNDARSIAVQYGFPHYILDIREEFTTDVIQNFISEYVAGRTPNPCVLCNTHIKWKALLKRANALQCDFIATGHYAKIRHENERYVLSKAKDLSKDQSYVLWGLTQDVLKKTIFPLGNLYKTEVRELAKQKGLIALSQKKESYEICFIPDNDYRKFLLQQNPALETQLANGVFKNTKGEIIGSHQGYPFFTIGQRKGLGVTFGKPFFVLDILPQENVVVLGSEDELLESKMLITNLNMIKQEIVAPDFLATIKIRYRDFGATARLEHLSSNSLKVLFTQQVKGIAPGQSAVFYDNDDVIGGGIIQKITD